LKTLTGPGNVAEPQYQKERIVVTPERTNQKPQKRRAAQSEYSLRVPAE